MVPVAAPPGDSTPATTYATSWLTTAAQRIAADTAAGSIDAVRAVLFYAAIVATAALVLERLPRRISPWLLAPLAPCVLLPLEIRTPGEFGLQYAAALITVAAAVGFCLWFARKNYLAYVLAFWAAGAAGPLVTLFRNSGAGMAIDFLC